MRSPAVAMAWEVWGRNRAGIAAVLLSMLGLSLLGFMLGVSLEPNRSRAVPVFIWSVILFAVAFLYLISIGLYGEIRQGKLLSGFPARMFTLPVRTSLLVLWPMLYGTAALVTLWMLMALLIWLPARAEVAWWLLPLLAVVLAWFQAVCWAVPGSPLVKFIAACIIFPALKFALELLALAVAWFGYEQTSLNREALIAGRVVTLTIYCTCFLPLAYVVAVWGVSRERRGANQDWPRLGRLLDAATSWLPKRHGRFASAARAQLWFEWRKKGVILPLFPVCFLGFISVVVVPFVTAEALLILLLVLTCLMPFVAFFVGYGLGKTSFWGGDLALSSLQATRPLGSTDLATAKIVSAAFSSLTAWLLILLVAPVWLAVTGSLGHIATYFLEQFSVVQICAFLAVAFLAMCAFTWGQLVGGLCLSLTGRAWVVNAGVGLYLVMIGAAATARVWVEFHPEEFDVVLTGLLWCAAAVAALKLLGAGWALVALHRQKLLDWRILGFVGMWLVGATAVTTLVYCVAPGEGLRLSTDAALQHVRLPVYFMAMSATLALPLVRLVSAPLGVAWNRVR